MMDDDSPKDLFDLGLNRRLDYDLFPEVSPLFLGFNMTDLVDLDEKTSEEVGSKMEVLGSDMQIPDQTLKVPDLGSKTSVFFFNSNFFYSNGSIQHSTGLLVVCFDTILQFNTDDALKGNF